MWTLLLLIEIYAILITNAVSEDKLSPMGDLLGPLGPTIIEKPNKVDDDVTAFDKAISQDKKIDAVAKLIGQRTLKQRLAIDKAYSEKFPQNTNLSLAINSLIDSKESDDRNLYRGFFLPLPNYLAECIAYSFYEFKVKGHYLFISILSTSSKTKLTAIVEAYKTLYKRDLSADIDKYTFEDDGRRALKLMLNPDSMRPDNAPVDNKLVETQLKSIPGGKVKCDRNADFINLLTSSSFEQIRQVAETWSGQNDKKSLVDQIRDQCQKGTPQEVYKRVVRFALNRYQYMAEELKLGLEKNEYNTKADSYLLTTRNEVDLLDIVDVYNKDNNKDLLKDMQADKDANRAALFVAVLTGNK